ncbi:hypothetical protein STEG23_010947, partial [Scotinomys teguina]
NPGLYKWVEEAEQHVVIGVFWRDGWNVTICFKTLCLDFPVMTGTVSCNELFPPSVALVRVFYYSNGRRKEDTSFPRSMFSKGDMWRSPRFCLGQWPGLLGVDSSIASSSWHQGNPALVMYPVLAAKEVCHLR